MSKLRLELELPSCIGAYEVACCIFVLATFGFVSPVFDRCRFDEPIVGDIFDRGEPSEDVWIRLVTDMRLRSADGDRRLWPRCAGLVSGLGSMGEEDTATPGLGLR